VGYGIISVLTLVAVRSPLSKCSSKKERLNVKIRKYDKGGKVKVRKYSTNPDPRTEPYRFGDDALLSAAYSELINRKGGSREDWEDRFDAVAFHESARTMDPAMKQIGGGPGRGLYQYEMNRSPETGVRGSGEANSAVKRTIKFLGSIEQPVPKWLSDLQGVDADFTKLTQEQQKLILIADGLIDIGDFGDVIGSESDFVDWWYKYHNRSGDPAARRKMASDTREYSNTYLQYQ